MERLLIVLLTGAVIASLTFWVFFVLEKLDKKVAFLALEEAALKKGDESLSLLLKQCQNEEERELVYKFALEQMEKEEKKIKELQAQKETQETMETEAVRESQTDGEEQGGETETPIKHIEEDRDFRDPEARNETDIYLSGTVAENEEEYTRIVDKY